MPASFIPQTDDGTTVGANAYIDVAFYRQYFLDRGKDLAAQTDPQVQVGIVIATDYIDNRWRLLFAGRVLTEDQTTEFPRKCIVSDGGKDLSATLPTQLKKATAEYAYRAVLNGQLVSDAPLEIVDGERQPTGEVLSTSITLGNGAVIDAKTYAESYPSPGSGTITTDACLLPEIPAADMLIEYLLDGSSRQRRTVRS